MAREEKNGCDGSDARLRRDEGCRVSKRGRRSINELPRRLDDTAGARQGELTLQLRTTPIPSMSVRPVTPSQTFCMIS